MVHRSIADISIIGTHFFQKNDHKIYPPNYPSSLSIDFFFSAALYLKNTIVKYWKAEETNELAEGEEPFSLDEQSKAELRDKVVGAIIQCPLISR